MNFLLVRAARAAAFALPLALAAVSAPHAAETFTAGDIVVETPWSRATPGAAPVAGGYLVVVNTGSEADRLVGGTSEISERFEVHSMEMVDGVARMAPVEGGLAIPPGESVTLAPGDYHVMFMGLRRPLTEGERFEAPATELQNRVRAARRAVALRGYQEAITWSFCRHDEADLFGGAGEGLQLENPISSELDVMRPSALIHLLKSVQKSADRGMDDARYFEAGPIYLDDTPKGQASVIAGARRVVAVRDWRGAEQPDTFDAKADALAALAACGAPHENAQVSRDAPGYYHPGRSGALRLGKQILAYFGELHPKVLEAYDMRGPVAAFEVFVDRLPQTKKRSGLTLSSFQPVERDFAFIVDEDVPAENVIRAAKGADKDLIAEVKLFDVYTGDKVGAGRKSLAIAVTLQPREKTLTEQEIDIVGKKVIEQVQKKTGGELRG